ncbi:MAG TPA: adenylate/guanylate cyclase domain-containing protein [Casimicrobiaceae bacterium]|nr:adenylate/guanylate cyclase domain-containing protein [Casimicrobiaceae bacterium]
MTIARRIPKFSVSAVVRLAIGLALVACLLVDAAGWVEIRALAQLELWAYDARVRLFLPRTRDPRIVIVDIDEKSLSAEGHWPWQRDKLALMLHQLFARYGVRVVGFDLAFPEPDTNASLPVLEAAASGDLRDDAAFQAFLQRVRPSLDYDRAFAEEIQKHPVVLGFLVSAQTQRSGVLPRPAFPMRALENAEYRYFTGPGYSGNIAPLQAAATAAGHLYQALDPDGVTRSVPMFMQVGNDFFEALSLAVLRVYLGNAPIKLETTIVDSGGRKLGWMRFVRLGDMVRIPLDERMAALVPFRAQHSYRYVSATDVIRGTVGADELKDRIVLVGTSARGLVDVRATPTQEDLPGVEIHASLISGALDNAMKSRPAETLAIAVLTILLVGLPLVVLLPRLSALGATLATAVVLALLLGVNAWAWQARNLVLPLAGPLVMLVGLYFLDVVWGFFAETRHLQLMTNLFGTYVPKEIVAEMAEHPDEYSMHGQSLDMTVLFADIRNFTSIAETRTPQDLKDLINAYFTRMTICIQDKRGTVDKYVGDAIMAFWGAPVRDAEHARRALECSLEMQKALRELDPLFAKKGWPSLRIGVGVNCGTMSVGDMGSQFRRSYTVMGDAVNLASRLEGLTKEYGVGVLVSENIVRAVQHFVYREVDKVRVKGKQQAVAIYQPIGVQGEIGGDTLAEIDRFHQALAHFRAQRWDEADALLEALAAAAPEVKLYRLYRERIVHFRASPPGADWDGIFGFATG